MVKISVITTTPNRTWLSFLQLRTRNSIIAGSWCYQKDGKRSSNRMKDIWLIKVHFLYRKNWVLFHAKNRNYLLANPIFGFFYNCHCVFFSVDRFQTTGPLRWRQLHVFQWPNCQPSRGDVETATTRFEWRKGSFGKGCVLRAEWRYVAIVRCVLSRLIFTTELWF